MARTLAKRKYVCRPGLVAAARDLGRSVSHLRRVVITKERGSHSLMERYRAWESQRKQQAVTATPIELAAAENLSPSFLANLSKLGLQVVIVRFQAETDSPIWKHDGIEHVLGAELEAVRAGQFDSEFYTNGARWFFYHVSNLGKAMQILKSALEARGLLEITTLLHAETAETLRVWYPATAELVNTESEEAEA